MKITNRVLSPSSNRLRAVWLQLMRFRLPLLIFLLFWGGGIITFLIIEENKNFWNILLISICAKSSEAHQSFFNLYNFIWPLMFELLILSFILTTIQEFYGFNPIVSSRKLASSQKEHTVVLGYNHLGMRIVEHLRIRKQPYALIEIEESRVEDLINLHQPVVIGDYTDCNIMKLAAVDKCKEVFCVTRDLRRVLIAAEKIRLLNKTCDLYMRVYNDHFREYVSIFPTLR